MKKVVSLIVIMTLFVILIGCSKTYYGTDELIEKSREEIPVSEADTIEIRYAGMCGLDDKALVWFISGNEYQAHYYLPMEVKVKGEAEYTFERVYKPMNPAQDIAVLNWNQGYSFIINNTNCTQVMIVDGSGTHYEPIEKSTYPYVFYWPLIPTEYAFLDNDGNELK